MPVTVQQSLERFVHQRYDSNRQSGREAEACANLLADYLQMWSGLLSHEWREGEEDAPEEWERELDAKMEQMLGGDATPSQADLGSLALDQLDEEHLREFVGWYLLKDLALDSPSLRGVLEMLRQWIDFAYRQRGLGRTLHRRFVETFEECAPEAERAVVAAHALQRLVLSGALYARSAQDSSMIECLLSATARVGVARCGDPCTHWLSVDEVEADRLPVTLPEALHPYIRSGDVVQVSLAQHADGAIRLVESGAIFPASTWVDAMMMEQFNPFDTVQGGADVWGAPSSDLLH